MSSTTSSNSYRNVTRYLGQDYRFAPSYLRQRDPFTPWSGSSDVKPPEQQGYYPIGSFWINLVNSKVFVLSNISSNLADWVLLSASIAGPILHVLVDANTAPGTDPVEPDLSGNITVTGAQVAAGVVGTNVIRTDSLAVNTYTIEIQRAAAVAATDVAQNGVSHYDSGQFSVDGNAFVQLVGGSAPAIQKVNVDASTGPGTDPVLADGAGQIIVTGGQVASGVVGTNVIRTDSLAANTYTIEIQRSAAVAATDITKNGVSHFDSSQFTVDANGFVSITSFDAFSYTDIDFADSPYTVLSTDDYISCDTSGGAITIRLPNAPTTDRRLIIKDRTGNASANNISVTTVGGAVTIDTQTTYTMAGNFDAINLLFHTASYEVY